MRTKPNPLAGYEPLDWRGPSELTKEEQETVERMRKDLWRQGVRTQPALDRLAFEFAAAFCMANAARAL